MCFVGMKKRGAAGALGHLAVSSRTRPRRSCCAQSLARFRFRIHRSLRELRGLGDEKRIEAGGTFETGLGDRREDVSAGVIQRSGVNRLQPRDAEWRIATEIAGD